ITVRDSSLSACTQAVVAAEVGQLELAHDYLAEAAFMDLHDLEHNVRDGVHIASLAGAWTALVAGFGGVRQRGDTLLWAPKLPAGIARLAMHVTFRGSRLRVEVTPIEATYRLLDGPELSIRHYGESLTLAVDVPISRAFPDIEAGPRPAQ